MIILARDDKTSACIFKYDERDNPKFTITLNGNSYTHAVDVIVKENYYKWYCEVLGRQFLNIYERSYQTGRSEVQNDIKNTLGLPRSK